MKENNKIRVEKISLFDKEKMEEAKKIRIEVFVKEQNVDFEADWDEKQSENYLVYYNDMVVGTMRWREVGRAVKIERVSVIKDFRGKGIASVMIRKAIEDIRQKTNKPIILHSQLLAIPLYERFGFRKQGKLFYEQNIAHYTMKKD
jgi:predicted GNAT family N-acyltransferase